MTRPRFFNTEGPVVAEDHYLLPPLERIDTDEVLALIHRSKYFGLHAPRQTGKTTVLLALADLLRTGGEYRAVYVNVEVAQSAREDVAAAMRAILTQIALEARLKGDDFLDGVWPAILEKAGPHAALGEALSLWAAATTQPLVLLIDEIDTLIGDTLLAVLRQLRGGYARRPRGFPQSIVLCGVRDVRDYRIRSSDERAMVLGGSAFNISARSLRLGSFTAEEVEALLMQHTEETGQAWTDEAMAEIWNATCGQPWLVNALAYDACFAGQAAGDRSRAVGADARDLGLIGRDGPVAIANPIYREVIPRNLTHSAQAMLVHDQAWYVDDDSELSLDDLLAGFQTFFRQHSEHWVERFDYREAGPQLLLQAFLQRIVNGGGRIEREYGLGRMRTDLLVVWPSRLGGETHRVIECKVLHGSLARTIKDGVAQTLAYMDRCDAAEGHLVVFDRTPDKPWEDKVFRREETLHRRAVTVWGM